MSRLALLALLGLAGLAARHGAAARLGAEQHRAERDAVTLTARVAGLRRHLGEGPLSPLDLALACARREAQPPSARELAHAQLLEIARLEAALGSLNRRPGPRDVRVGYDYADAQGGLRHHLQDGEVVYAEHATGTVWIDRGRRHRLPRGLRLRVFRYEQDRWKTKGWLAVRQVDEDVARCAIVAGDPEDPIVRGDLVESPFYAPHEPPVIVFLGERLARRSLRAVDARLSNLGAVVEPGLSIATDVAVIPERRPADWGSLRKRMQQLSCRQLPEWLLDHYLPARRVP